VCNFENSLCRPPFFFGAVTQTQEKTSQRWCTEPASFIMDGRHPEWLPRRAAQPISSAHSGERSVAARWSGAAPGLSSGRFAAVVTAI
jgi:hypothetical protein